jgi:hypothetical protein
MSLVSDSEQNIQILINRAKFCVNFANIRLNTEKHEVMIVNLKNDDRGIVINDVSKGKYCRWKVHEILRNIYGSKKVSKMKFIENKIQKILEELNKIEYNKLALNQV